MRSDWETIDPRVRRLLVRISGSIAALPGVEKIVLYGSYAKGTSTKESDIDLAVFFRDGGNPLLEEYRRLARICATPEFDIQVQPFLSSELEAPCGIVEEIDMYGVELPLCPPVEAARAAEMSRDGDKRDFAGNPAAIRLTQEGNAHEKTGEIPLLAHALRL